MAGLTMHIDTKGFDKLADPAVITRARNAMVEAALDVVTREAKNRAPGQGRKYIGSLFDASRGEGLVKAVFPLTFQITGTKAHEIRPRQGGRRGRKVGMRTFKTAAGTVKTRQQGNFTALRFSSGGQTFFRRYVPNHPGVRANPFLDEVASATNLPAGHAADAALQKVFDAAGL